jgi:hypothetical protein
LYQWKVGIVEPAEATNSTYIYTPVNGDIVTCKLTSSEQCKTGSPATSNAITVVVKPDLLVGSISADQTICAGSTPALLTGVAPGNGTSPSYQWQSNEGVLPFEDIIGATSLDFQPGPLFTTTHYRLIQDAAGTCGGPLATNTVIITVNPVLPVSVSVAASANPVCAGTMVTFTATPVNGGTTPAYQWSVNSTNTGLNSATFAYQPGNGDVVACVLSSSETSR